jgi:hypothetical protein
MNLVSDSDQLKVKCQMEPKTEMKREKAGAGAVQQKVSSKPKSVALCGNPICGQQMSEEA